MTIICAFMKVRKVSIRQKVGVALAIFFVWLFFVSFLYGNISTDKSEFQVLTIVLILGGPIILFWSLVLHFAFFEGHAPLTIVEIAISLGTSFFLYEPIQAILGNIGIAICLVCSFSLGILLLHYR